MTPLPPFDPDDLEPIDLIPDPVIGVDTDRRITLWNRAAERTYGFTRAEAMGQRAPELLRTRFSVPLAEILKAVTDAGHWRGNAVHCSRDGRELFVESRWTARYDEQGNVSGGVQIDRNRNTTVESAHELNNLLTVILNYAGLIAGELEAMARSSTDPHWVAMRADLVELELATLRTASLIRELVAVSPQGQPRSGG